MSDALLAIASGAATALLGVGAAGFWEDYRARRDGRDRALALVRAVRHELGDVKYALSTNESSLRLELDRLGSENPGWVINPLQPIRTPAVDLVRIQQHRDIPARAVIAAAQFARVRDALEELRLARAAWRQVQAPRWEAVLSVYDENLLKESTAVGWALDDVADQFSGLEAELTRPSKFWEYYQQAGQLEP